MTQISSSASQSSVKRRGRPLKKADQERCRKVTIALTETEYQYFKKLAGHEALPTLAGPTARPRRRHGSMAGLIRLLMKRSGMDTGLSPLATVEQERLLSQLANQTNVLRQLIQLADRSGFLAVVVQLTNLLQRLSAVLDTYDQTHKRKSAGGIH